MAETTEEYRARIDQLESNILTEPDIGEMRSDISEGVGKTGNRQADIEVRQDILEDDFVAVQQDASSVSPSGAEVAVARGNYNTLDERLTKKEQESNALFAQIVNINVSNFGIIGDGETDNSQAFISLNAYISSNHSNDDLVIFFPKGHYVTYIGLELSARNIIVFGNHVVFDKRTDTFWRQSVGFQINQALSFLTHGIKHINTVENKEVEVVEGDTLVDGQFYHIRCTSETERFIVYNSEFVDNVSIPNRKRKPFNGSIYAGTSEFVSIFENKFIDSVGRVIYTRGAKTVNIFNNKFENLGVLKYAPTYENTVTMVFRTLSSEKVNIYGNTVTGTTEDSTNQQVRIFEITKTDDDSFATPSNRINVHDNTIQLNAIKDARVIRLQSINKASFHDNDVELDEDNRKQVFLYGEEFNETQSEYKDILVTHNIIRGAHDLLSVFDNNASLDKFKVIIQGNTVFSEKNELKRFGQFTEENRQNLHVSKNEYFYKGKYIKELTLNSSQIKTNQRNVLVKQITAENDYDSTTEEIRVDWEVTTCLVRTHMPVSNIQFFNAPDDWTGKQIEIINNVTATNTNEVTIKFSNVKIRTPRQENVILGQFESATLVFLQDIWYVKSVSKTV